MGATALARRGRKRKTVMHPVVVERVKITPAEVAASMPHRKGVLLDFRLDQKAESELGRMCLRGQITDLQFEAGQRFAAIVGAYRATIEMPQALAGRGRGYDCNPDTCAADVDCICRIRKERYDAAYEALWKAGQVATKAVSHVAVHDRLCPPSWQIPLEWGLSALVHYLGLTNEKKGLKRGN